MGITYEAGSVVFQTWSIQRLIGEGSFGKVFEIRREDFGEVYTAALKVITVPQNKNELQNAYDEGMTETQAEEYFYGMVQDIVREFAIMARLKGTGNVVSYEDHTVIRHQEGLGWDILIRMELLTPLLAYAKLHPFTRRDVIRLGIDICKALELCQKYNVIHRDIKPENIFVSENGDFKLGDFGIARTIERASSELSKKGTYNYMAPEVYRGEEYGFSVDLYSLGIVLYRLLNRNRLPFLPPHPQEISFRSRENALARRMAGETPESPCYAQGRLGEIVQKACAFDPKERYSSPAQMRQELEAILYDQRDAQLIYPEGDEIAVPDNLYVSRTPDRENEPQDSSDGLERTKSQFGVRGRSAAGEDRTVSAFESRGESRDPDDRTSSNFGSMHTRAGTAAKAEKVSKVSAGKGRGETGKKKSKAVLIILCCVCLVMAVAAGGFVFISRQKKAQQAEAAKQAHYGELMERADQLCSTDPKKSQELYLEAQQLYPNEIAPYVSYAYALYCNGDYQPCVTYIEDELALGKEYETKVQDQLSEILGAAYFELDDYAAAASFFRLSTAGGDITVPAMRDYAVSLGRLGDVSAADEILQRMYDAGASGDVTAYVQAEVDYALKEYEDAERGFLSVLDSSDDEYLQKRCVRSLGELYRDCDALARIGESPIYAPATKAAALLSDAIVKYEMRYDSAMWEMLAMAYFESYHTDSSVDKSYLVKAADCFTRVIELGVQKDYLYSNLYTIYYELEDYEQAGRALDDYEVLFPYDYMPHALRGMMLITIENKKSQDGRDYSAAIAAYEKAGELIRGSDDATYYQQLESLIDQLKKAGWI